MNESAWLNANEQHAWLGLVLMMTGMDAALDGQLQQDSGISYRTYMVLGALSASPDQTLSISDLAQMTHGSPSRVSHAIARLEVIGWIERSRPDTDKRVVRVSLTESGRATLRSAAPGHTAQIRRVLIDRLSAEQLQQLKATALAVVDGLAELGFAPPGWPELPGFGGQPATD